MKEVAVNKEAFLGNVLSSVKEAVIKKPANESTPVEASKESSTSLREVRNDVYDGAPKHEIQNDMKEELRDPEVQQALVRELSPYSEEVNGHIRSLDELSVYENQNLTEATVNDRQILQLPEGAIDPEQKDAMGRTNLERTESGLSALDKDGNPVNLHHIGQKENSPLAELPDRIHKQYDSVLHDKTIASEVHGPGNNWDQARADYWRARSDTL